MKKAPKTISAYLAALDNEKRTALQKLRRAIHAAAPNAEECISYQVPAFRFEGRMLVWFAAASKHCSFFPGAHPIARHKDELKAYKTSKGTVRFAPDAPLPGTLVKKLVRTRIAENRARSRA
jgi:uncharacterized protein YdhG (YjbR/CyaY superfamily)